MISIYNSVNSEVEAQIIILDITQSEHPMFESLDSKLEKVYSLPRFGLIFIDHLEYKIDSELLMNLLIGEIKICIFLKSKSHDVKLHRGVEICSNKLI